MKLKKAISIILLNKSKVLLLLILFLGLLLRINNYTQSPPRGASSDEYTIPFLD